MTNITEQATSMLGARKQKFEEPPPIFASNGKSALVAAVEERNRQRNQKAEVYDIAGFLGLDGPVHKVRVRVAMKAEQDRALIEAHDAIEKAAKRAESLRSDIDFCNGKKAVMLIHGAIRDFADPDSIAAFPTPEWMEEQLTPDQITVLLNIYNREVAKAAPSAIKFEAEQVETLMSICGTAYETDIPERALLHFTREQVAELFINASIIARVRAEECDMLRERVKELEAQSAAPPEDVPNPEFVFVPE